MEERLLVKALVEAQEHVKKFVEAECYEEAMQYIGGLRLPLDAFFETVIVNADDARVRINRLHILAAIRALLHQVANFSCVEG